MKFLRSLLLCLSVILLCCSSVAHAEDIDVFSDNSANSGVPNVLFVLDNAANFSASAANCTYDDGTSPSLNGTAGGIEQCALYNLIKGLPDGTVNIGLMVYNDNNMRDFQGLNCGGANGGCLAYPLTFMSGPAKTNFLAWIRSWGTTYDIKAAGKLTASTMQESWAYYAGNVGMSGRSYAGIQPTVGCQKNFLIFIGNSFNTSGGPGDGGNLSPNSYLAAAPKVTDAQKTIITIPSGSYGTKTFSCQHNNPYVMGNNHADLYADEWARYMHQADLYGVLEDSQGITTYTVGLLGPSCQADYPALLTSMAKMGGGKYFATTNYDEIATAILKILNEIQAVNSVFSSASLPVSVNAQGTYLNQIFLGMFRPDANGNPRWVGNLKQYEFMLSYPDPSKPDPNKATLQLADSTGASAISTAGTGFIAPDAISFWTSKNTSVPPDSTGGFFVNDPRGSGLAFDSPDGELVEKGGVAQQLRLNNLTVDYTATPAGPRRLYTYCPSGTGCVASLTDNANAFATTNSAITEDLLRSVRVVRVTSITRSGAIATVTTGESHLFAVGDEITVEGASPIDYNGKKTVLAFPAPTANQFAFLVPDYPPSPATGSYQAFKPLSPMAVTSITRVGNLATATTSTPHGYATGMQVNIGNAAQADYNGTKTITVVNATQFTFPVTVRESPPTLAGSGQASVGTGNKCCETIKSAAASGVVRNSGSSTVRIYTSNPHIYLVNNQVVLAGIVDAAGTAVPAYTGTFRITAVDSAKTKTWFEITLPGPAIVEPTTPATVASGSSSITVDNSAPAIGVTLSRTGAVATATTVSGLAHGFNVGDTVTVSGIPGANESNYLGSFSVKSVSIDKKSFDFDVVLYPTTVASGANITVQRSGISERTVLINWLRGQDNYGDEAGPGSPYTVRPSIHGDVLHSRPAVVNYGDARGVVVFYGANDGVFRAVNGNQTGNITSGSVSVQPGGELWGLILPEHYNKLNRQRVNSPELKLSTTSLPSAQPKDYFVDGVPGLYQKVDDKGVITQAIIYLTMRRGGRFLYAIDITQPLAPSVLWRISASGDFAELGQTWSRPRVTLVKGYASPVLVFGAGYDPAEDAEPPATSTMGRGIFVLDALTGARIWKATYSSGETACSGTSTQAACGVAGMNWSIAADISFVDRDNDGKTDRFYAADMGGNVWRVDLEPTTSGVPGITPDKWKVSKFASLGCNSGACASGATPRKFFFPPNVVQVGATAGTGSYDAVMLGSGDREHPLKSSDSFNVTNRFYVLKDSATGKDASTTTITEADLFNAGNVTDTMVTPYTGALRGFYLTFAQGEKSVNASVTTRGTTYFATNKPTPPSATSCGANLGQAKAYALDPFKGTFTTTVFDGGGLPPSPTTGIVTIKIPGTDTSVQKAFCVGCGGGTGGDSKSALGAEDINKAVPKNLRRTYWYKK